MVTGAIGLSRRTLRTIGLQLGRCTSLPSPAPLPFNRLFRQTAAVSHLRPRITRQGSNGILTVSAIAITFRIMLRTRLTLNRLALFRKPWSCGGGHLTPLIVTYTYICFSIRSSMARATPSTPNGMLPYRYLSIPWLR